MANVRLFWGSFVALFLVGVIVALPGAALPEWRGRYGVGEEVSWFFTALLLGLLLGVRLAQGERRHPLLPAALGLAGLALWGVALAPSFPLVVALAFLLGLGEGVMNVHGNSLVGELDPKRRVELLNRVNVAFGLGAVFTPFALTLLPYGAVLFLAGFLAWIGALLLWEAPQVTQVPKEQGRGLWPFLLAVAIYTGLEGALATWNRVWLEHLGHPTPMGGVLLSLYWLFLALGRLFLAKLVAQKPLAALRSLLLGVLALLFLNLLPPTALLFPLAGFLLGPLFSTLFALVQARFGHRALGGLLYAGATGSTLIPALFALLPTPGIPYGLLGLALGLFLMVSSLERRAVHA
ncbi:MFS transporter [Thermus scotoductus]|uniref:MFS transporter n=1 Tax=Thermus scotoductus TaxID=37636 RepID=A0A430QY89_THESC|nr:MFS transporter [Thermus scotoductus]RTH00094.1 MFS transporter [Thermus scotoductus]RTH35417.1 MFS transporter [Thermus scotoductus]RTI02956.1 MFS transporter [Thermus scotoductus]RTI11174.1 MFS transporter [Thermus scotoductus]